MLRLISEDHFIRSLAPWIRFSLTMVLITAPGCSRIASSDVTTQAGGEHAAHQGRVDGHEDDHHHGEHDHDHHHVPDHKPENFSSLVINLDSRLQATEFSDHSWEEVIDLVRWVPELAADSDLRRKDFESAVRVSESLLAELDQIVRQKPVRISQKAFDGVGVLKDLATRSDLRPKVESGGAPSGESSIAAEHSSE